MKYKLGYMKSRFRSFTIHQIEVPERKIEKRSEED